MADVWLNGEKLGQHKGAFTAFRFDITSKLKTGKNVLLVKTDNSATTTNADLTAIAPLSGDFNMAGGLYRGVSLVSTPSAAHFALDDLGSSGIFVKTTSVSGGTATVIRNEGDIRGVNTKGLVTFDHKTKKDPFYFYQANWSKQPVTHVVGKRYTDRAYQYADVKVYSNADSVTLKVNGNSVATMTAAQCAWKTCVFPNVKLNIGTNSIEAEGSRLRRYGGPSRQTLHSHLTKRTSRRTFLQVLGDLHAYRHSKPSSRQSLPPH